MKIPDLPLPDQRRIVRLNADVRPGLDHRNPFRAPSRAPQQFLNLGDVNLNASQNRERLVDVNDGSHHRIRPKPGLQGFRVLETENVFSPE
jgi:hypothetical protein